MLKKILTFIFLGLIFTLTITNRALANEMITEPAIPNRLHIPSITLDVEIVSVGWQAIVIDGQTYGQWLVDNNLVGWQNLSAPLGEVGNTVLNGHSDIYDQVFSTLHLVQVGDEITVFAGEQARHYVVTDVVIVPEVGVSLDQRIANAQWIAPTNDERLTLVTCIYGATHRLLVIAHPVRQE